MVESGEWRVESRGTEGRRTEGSGLNVMSCLPVVR